MRLQVFSDFHFDVTPGFEPRLASGVDVAIVAGDVCQGIENGCRWLRRHLPPPTPIILVPGNHEYYGSVRADERALGQAAGRELGMHVLDDRAVEIGGVRFVGSTLWTDYDVFGREHREAAMVAARQVMFDHSQIREGAGESELFLPEHAREQHLASRAFIEGMLWRRHSGPTVVVSHHAPHARSIAERYASDIVTAAFVSDLSPLIAATRPALWVHGHTHASFDYRVGATRVVCNPLGYGDENPMFDPALVVEL